MEVIGRRESRADFSAFPVPPTEGCSARVQGRPVRDGDPDAGDDGGDEDTGPGAGQPLPSPGDPQRVVRQAREEGIGGGAPALFDMGVQGIAQGSAVGWFMRRFSFRRRGRRGHGRRPRLGEGGTEGGQGLVGLAADGALGDAQDRGDLGVRPVLEVAQHDHRALAFGELSQRGHDVVALDHGVGPVGGLRGRVRDRVGDRLLAPTEQPEAVYLGVVDHPADVGLRLLPVAQPRPAPGRGRERGLEQVAGLLPVPGQQVRRVQQRSRPRRHELAELAFIVGVQSALPCSP